MLPEKERQIVGKILESKDEIKRYYCVQLEDILDLVQENLHARDVHDLLYHLTVDLEWLQGAYAKIVSILRECGKDFEQALDIGCGAGAYRRELKKVARRVVSIDLEWDCLRIIKRADRKGAILNTDACELPFPSNTFDLVFTSEVIEHVLSPEEFVRETCRVLKPNGVILLTTTTHYFFIFQFISLYFIRNLGRLLRGLIYYARGYWNADARSKLMTEIFNRRDHLHSFTQVSLCRLLRKYTVDISKIRYLYTQDMCPLRGGQLWPIFTGWRRLIGSVVGLNRWIGPNIIIVGRKR